MDMDVPTVVEEDIATTSNEIPIIDTKDTWHITKKDPVTKMEKGRSGLGEQRIPAVRELRIQRAKFGMTLKFVGGVDSAGLDRSSLTSHREASVPPKLPPALPEKRISRKSCSKVILKRSRSPSTSSTGSKKRVRFSIPHEVTNDLMESDDHVEPECSVQGKLKGKVEPDPDALLPPPESSLVSPPTSSIPLPPDSPPAPGSIEVKSAPGASTPLSATFIQPPQPRTNQIPTWQQQPCSDLVSSSTDFPDAKPPLTPSTGYYTKPEGSTGVLATSVPEEWGKYYISKEFLLRNPVSRSVLNLFRCQHCPKKFSFKCYLNAHYRKEHKPKGRRSSFECQECPESYQTFGELMKHRELAHNYDSQLEGENCIIM